MRSPGNPKSTSWGEHTEWYATHLAGDDTYHNRVIIPNVMRVLSPKADMKILDLACGEGMLSRALSESGASVVGTDISPELIAHAKKARSDIAYHVADAGKLAFALDAEFDAVVCVLALQNMERPEHAVDEAMRILRAGGRFVMVLNHPVLRIPKRSSWGFDGSSGVQYRRLDGYYIPTKEKMLAHPGEGEAGGHTWSFHRSLDAYMKILLNRGFVVTGFEEWLSHKTSEKGPKKAAEDRARKEFPLFLMIEATRER
jgi:SAM-dependent methyltransferase